MSAPAPELNLTLLNPSQVEAIRQLCLDRFDFFCAAILKYKVTPFHAKMINHWLTTKHGMVLAPRGSGKSTILDVAYCIWRIIKNRNIRICIVSKSGPQAKSFLGEIKTHLESNVDLIQLFGEFKTEDGKWNEDEILVSGRTKILKEPTIVAKSVGAGIPGFHFDLIVADDLCDAENTATELQRDKMEHWFRVVLSPTLEPTGEFRIIGTRYHSADLYGLLATKVPMRDRDGQLTGEVTYKNKRFGPNTLVIPAITQDENGLEQSFWPEYFELTALQELREENLFSFNLAYQNDASILEGGIIKLEDLEEAVYLSDGHLPPWDQMIIFQGVDPAISLKQTADFFAHATIGVHGRHIYLLELILARLPFNEQVDLVINQWVKWGATLVGIETVAYQQALVQRIKEKAVWFPAHEIKPNKDKTFRATVFSQFTQRREFHVSLRHTHVIETLVKMPNVEHDDAFDAIDHAVTAAKQSVLAQNIVTRMPTNFRRR